MINYKLTEIDWPEFGTGELPSPPTLVEFEKRIENARLAMETRALTHLIIYADREHFANLAYLTGFDPRFEESLLIIGLKGLPLILVGNECGSYLPISPLLAAKKLRHERYQPFSLLDQPRDSSRLLGAIFLDEGINEKSYIGCVGWKYFSEIEHPKAKFAIELPSFVVDTLRKLSGWDHVTNVTDIFMHSHHGLRANCSAAEIAFFEYTGILASEGMKRMILNLEEGMTDFEVMAQAQMNGIPLGCHPTFRTGNNDDKALVGPSGQRIARGNLLSTNICYWGSNTSRAGWIVERAGDLPIAARDYVENFAGIYFEVLSEWLRLLKIGTLGDTFYRLIQDHLPYDKFGIFLNPGHLIHLDEWLSAPIYSDSTIPIRSGMVMQVDVIPSSPTYFSTRMEDGIAIADESLRKEINNKYPECYLRCMKRREFMINVLNMDLPEELLPLSNIAGIVPPFFLNHHQIFTLEA